MRIPLWLAPLCLVFVMSCAQQPPAPALPPFDTTISVPELMESVMDPAADGVWEAVGTIYTKDGAFEKVPADDDEWNAVRAKAITLVETGNLLLLPSRSTGNEDGLFNTGADLYESCVNCHKRFDPAITSVK